jgi:hypothetical protein
MRMSACAVRPSRSPAPGSSAPVLPARSALQQLQLGRSAARLLPAGHCSCSVLSRALGFSTGAVALTSRSVVLVLQLSSKQAGNSLGVQLQCSTVQRADCSCSSSAAPQATGSSTRQRIWPKKISLYIILALRCYNIF